MKKYIALLRGINVGGKRKMKMADLRAACETLGWKELRTYIQSGNVLFACEEQQINTLEQQLSALILREFGFEVPVMILEKENLESIFNKNYFVIQSEKVDKSSLHVTFLSREPSGEEAKLLKEGDYKGDLFEISGKTVYLQCVGSYHKSKLTNQFWEKKLKCRATTRNWKTITKLVEMVRG